MSIDSTQIRKHNLAYDNMIDYRFASMLLVLNLYLLVLLVPHKTSYSIFITFLIVLLRRSSSLFVVLSIF